MDTEMARKTQHLLGQLDAYAAENSQTRAEAIRDLLREALAASRPSFRRTFYQDFR